MAKVGTAHLEIKPVLNEEALRIISERIEEAVTRGVRAALSERALFGDVHVSVGNADGGNITLPLSKDNPLTGRRGA